MSSFPDAYLNFRHRFSEGVAPFARSDEPA
jgi:hypothetical protein